ncbi:MAG: TatD family hydrolase [Eubacterium sp.]|nr:TatD family hydrolase [Eubacterium sp.]
MEKKEYYDIGLNLFCSQFKHPDKVLQRAAEAGVTCILTGSDPKENQTIDTYLKDHPEVTVYGTAGQHPHNADHFSEEVLEEVRRIYTVNPRVVAVGECGLDYNRMFSTKENQLRTLERYVALAEELQAPMFLHERDATEDFAAVFSAVPEVVKRSVVHCFTGDRATAEKYLDMGFSIGVTGWICDDRRAEELRDAVRVIPKDRILIETDAPYLTPRNVKDLGRTNVPENIVYVARTLADYMQLPEEELIRCTVENTKRVFGIGQDR